MCIICNMSNTTEIDTAICYLHQYQAAQWAMQKATETMHAISKLDLQPEDKKRYDRAHKAMVKVIRQWNEIEHLREAPIPIAG